ncbi:MAG: phytanoyl-CoA dioxygenase [Reyranella sp.]|uniref:phytanoyl-CoA dioxygenase family protein n=1 Tax=Reyranella sp. TaxID=1929291 RepID=UPI001202E254|nr:phytanoyl-CoA dioxygenase family protein [Reyranella sp.]TAJ42057.1 MAG: phytanoyl-CoA dioxygenase [Reyranella sp.]
MATPQATPIQRPAPLTAQDHARAMADYSRAGEARARALGNRGPIRFDADGKLDSAILDSYWTHGFYVFEGVVGAEELAELRADVDAVLARAPASPEADRDRKDGIIKPPYRWARPLSDPVGGTDANNGRHPVEMLQPTLGESGPAWTVELLDGNLHLMDAALRLYGHPGLLGVAAGILGDDFVPYNEVTFVKEAGLGPSVAWHQDGTTHWTAPDWDMGAHGFNFMTQLYASTAGNGVWVLPGSHKLGKADIKRLVAGSGSDRIEGAVPMLCAAGDTIITNRQLLHGSFANSSPDRRITLNAGFFPRKRVLGVTARRLNGVVETYDKARIDARCRILQIAIDARKQRFPQEQSYVYRPLAGQEENNRWNETARETVLKNYNQRDMFI